ncbi:MAG: hypothetical protein JXQ73_13105 [Phycisphaerae bacterium]|nr:hypothetical protein [Phycisphaerae bacterium]
MRARTLDETFTENSTRSGVGPTPPRYWWLRRIGLVSLVIVVGLVGLRAWWGQVAARRLRAEIERIQAAGEPIFPNDFDPPPVSDEENGALMLIRAAEAIPASTSDARDITRRLLDDPNELVKNPDAAVELLAKTVEARALARRARSCRRDDWGLRARSPVISIVFAGLGTQRRLARVLAIAARDAHRGGDDGEAIETVRDILAQADHMESYSTVIGHLVAIANANVAAREALEIAPALRIAGDVPDSGAAAQGSVRPATAGQARSLITELLDDSAARRGHVRAYQYERMMLLDTAQLLASGRMGLGGLDVHYEPGVLERAILFLVRPLFLLDGERVVRDGSVLAVAAGAPTHAAATSQLPAPPGSVTGLRGVGRLLSSTLVASYGRAFYLHFLSLANRRQAAVALAIRLYEVDHGRRPKRLEELVPGYLPEIPLDPVGDDLARFTELLDTGKPGGAAATRSAP